MFSGNDEGAAPACFLSARNPWSAAISQGDGSTLGNREFGTNFIRTANGGLATNGISVGNPAQSGSVPNVVLDMTGVTHENWMGDIHNHPSGDGRLSGGEWANFISFVGQVAAVSPGRISELNSLTAYVVVLDASAPDGYRIFAYNRNSPPDQLGAEVNPNAQPCP